MLRTKTCGELRSENIGEEVTLCGWVDGYRDHNGVVFIDLRDRYGITQVAFKLDLAPEIQEQARKLRNEDVLRATGTVIDRGENVNPKLDTGKIEIHASELEVYSKSKTPRSSRVRRSCQTKNCDYSTVSSTYAVRSCTTHWQSGIASAKSRATISIRRVFWKSKPPCSAAARRKAHAITSFPVACIPVRSTRCRSRRKSTSKF